MELLQGSPTQRYPPYFELHCLMWAVACAALSHKNGQEKGEAAAAQESVPLFRAKKSDRALAQRADMQPRGAAAGPAS